MSCRLWCAVWICWRLVIPASTATGQDLDSLVSGAVQFSKHRLGETIMMLGDTALFPRSTEGDGGWKLVKPADWTSGFFPGSLWLAFELSGDSALLRHAARWTEKLEDQKMNTKTHDVGFIMYCSFGNGIRLASAPSYRHALLTAAQSLSTRFNPRVGCIRSWDNRKWPYPVIIDNMMNLELLFWAAKNGGPGGLYETAVTHALTTMRNHFRPDGGTYHVVSYDTATGTVLARETHQGFADESVWARGQAWALYGFTMAFRETRDERFLETAEKAANYFLDHLPEDGVPYWDFLAPGIPDEPRDASAAAIAASGLFELSMLATDPAAGARYLGAARSILERLCRPPYLAAGSTSPGLLLHAVGNKPSGLEVDVSLIYADYYFLEALLRYQATRKL